MQYIKSGQEYVVIINLRVEIIVILLNECTFKVLYT